MKGQIVKHKAFGARTIIKSDDNLVVISFTVGDKRFQFSEAFGSFLVAEDESFAAYVDAIKKEKEQKKTEERAIKLEVTAIKQATEVKEPEVKHKKMARDNIAFMCNYCDLEDRTNNYFVKCEGKNILF